MTLNRIPSRWQGWLVPSAPLPTEQQHAWDAMHYRDVTDPRSVFDRPITDIERTLLIGMGFDADDVADITVHCHQVTGGIVQRRYPALESLLTEDDSQ